MKDNIVLIGFMGCGKTTVGEKLAADLSFDFIDTDQYIEEKEAMIINDIFAAKGEEYFRGLETSSLEELIACTEKTIVSSGGGLPLRKENAELLVTPESALSTAARPTATDSQRSVREHRCAPHRWGKESSTERTLQPILSFTTDSSTRAAPARYL